jgi:hypothetical protein
LENAYHEAVNQFPALIPLENSPVQQTNDEVIDDEALFGNEDEEDNAFVM